MQSSGSQALLSRWTSFVFISPRRSWLSILVIEMVLYCSLMDPASREREKRQLFLGFPVFNCSCLSARAVLTNWAGRFHVNWCRAPYVVIFNTYTNLLFLIAWWTSKQFLVTYINIFQILPKHIFGPLARGVAELDSLVPKLLLNCVLDSVYVNLAVLWNCKLTHLILTTTLKRVVLSSSLFHIIM